MSEPYTYGTFAMTVDMLENCHVFFADLQTTRLKNLVIMPVDKFCNRAWREWAADMVGERATEDDK